MQERRATIRASANTRAQYCPLGDLIPRDGRITNVSEGGAHVLTRERHEPGSRITVSFTLPGEEEWVTATGQVRWTDGGSGLRGHEAGLAWQTIGEQERHRLRAFLHYATASASHPAPTSLSSRRRQIRRIAWGSAACVVLLAGVPALRWGLTLQQDNRQLGRAIQQRNAVIQELEQREVSLQEHIAASEQRTAVMVQELNRLANDTSTLRMEAKQFEQDVARLHGEVEHFQSSYTHANEQTAQLRTELTNVEQARGTLQLERDALAERLSSIPELRKAIREAVRARRLARRANRAWIPTADLLEAVDGNRGYLIREGDSIPGSGMRIFVHEPQTTPLAPPAPPVDTPAAP